MTTVRHCAQCGQPCAVSHRFCGHCGALLDVQRELKQVTVLLVDLCDSTSQVADIPIEDAQGYLDAAYRIMAEAVDRFGGTRVQWRGDELLALFGAPKARERHAADACRAALRILARMAEQTGPAPMNVRIGLDSGEVIVGPSADDLSARYSADGAPIHLASRLERAAQPGTALMTAATRRLAGEQIDASSQGLRPIRGFKAPVEVFQLHGERHFSATTALSGRTHLAPLVGRGPLLADLLTAAAASRQTGLRAVGLRGEAGIGKSRLLDAFIGQQRQAGQRVAVVCARSYAGDMPLGLAADLVRALLDLEGLAPSSDVAFVDLLGAGDPGEAWRELSPTLRRKGITEAAVRLIQRLTQHEPLTVVIDDVFLADADSLRLLDQLAARARAQSLFIVLSYRTEFAHRWTDSAWFQERTLTPLPPQQMAELAQALLGSDPSLADVGASLMDRADGNPFFFEQLALMLVDDGTLSGRPGAYRAHEACAELGVPASVMAAIAARVDRLSAAAKLSLEAGAVAGDPLDIRLIAAIRQLDTDTIATHLGEAVSRELARAEADDGTRYRFSHALVRETVYKGLTRARRTQLHRDAFRALKAGPPAPDAAPVLALHAYLGGDWDAAAEHSQIAMSRSTLRSANRDALRVFERGLEATARITEERPRLARELALRVEALGPLMAMGALDALVTNLERAEVVTRTLGDARRQAAVSLQLAVCLWTRGNYRQGLEAAETAGQAASASGSRSLQMAARQARMMLHHGIGRLDLAQQDAAAVEAQFGAELAARRLLPGWAVVAIVNLKAFQADLMAQAGQLEQAQAALDSAYQELAAQEHPFSRTLVDFVQAGLQIQRGQPEAAARLLESSEHLCRSQDVATMLPPIVVRRAGALALIGRTTEGLSLIEHATERKDYLLGGRYNDFYFPYYQAVALFAAERFDDAYACARQASAAALQHEQVAHAGHARWLEARAAAAAGRREEAFQAAQAARAIARECPMAWLAAQLDAESWTQGIDHAH